MDANDVSNGISSNEQSKNKNSNLNYFSEKLTNELKQILQTQQKISKASNTEIQEIGRHIAQFILLKEIQKNRGKNIEKTTKTR